jgi:hypothetical protein
MTSTHVTVVEKTSDLVPWLTFGASVLLALITLWYVVITARILRQSQAVELARNLQIVQAQAGTIAAWVSNSEVDNQYVTVTTTLSNPSSQAIYALELTIVDLDGGELPAPPFMVPVLGPDERKIHKVSCSLPARASGALRASFKFVDGQGVRWRRNELGTLEQILPG